MLRFPALLLSKFHIFPVRKETIVSALDAREVIYTLGKYSQAPSLIQEQDEENNPVLFIGVTGTDHFRISRKINYGDNFNPLITGRVEACPTGSIIFLTYRMFWGALIFLIFWSVLSVLMFFYFLIIYNAIIFSLIALMAGAGNYFFSILNLNRRIEQVRNNLLWVLNIHHPEKE